MICFPDLSEHQDSVDFAALRKQTNCVAHRVSYGYRLDHKIEVRKTEIRQQKFDFVIWYLFLRASQAVEKQVQAVINCIGDLQAGELICVDWEADGHSIPSVGDRDKAAAIFERRYNRPTIIYGSESSVRSHPVDRLLWVAKYGKQPTVANVIWQFTNGVISDKNYPPMKFAGVKYGCGFCDANMVEEKKLDELIRLAGGRKMEQKKWFVEKQYTKNDREIFHVRTKNLGDQGEGWVLFNGADGLPDISIDRFDSFSVLGVAPQRDGNQLIPSLSVVETDGRIEVAVMNGIPKGEFAFRLSCFV